VPTTPRVPSSKKTIVTDSGFVITLRILDKAHLLWGNLRSAVADLYASLHGGVEFAVQCCGQLWEEMELSSYSGSQELWKSKTVFRNHALTGSCLIAKLELVPTDP
jgi:hypothetical protein